MRSCRTRRRKRRCTSFSPARRALVRPVPTRSTSRPRRRSTPRLDRWQRGAQGRVRCRNCRLNWNCAVTRLVLILALAAGICEGQARPCDPQTPLGPSHDLYCIELVAAPGVTGASGRVELSIPPGPFTVAVTPDGRSRFIPIVALSGLPDTGVFVAWVAPPQMDSLIKLGTVNNGRTTLRSIALEKFNFIITAERSARVREPRGRVILRGQSPSTRLFPPDLLEFSLGNMGQGQASADHHEHESVGGWPMVPMPAGITMLPSEMALRPEVTPYLPVADTTAPLARPREVIRVSSGDTVRLSANLVRRVLNGRTYTMFGYNGQYPGPLIEAARGSEIVVQFTNQLPDSSSIHWHGIRVDNAFDGVDAVDRTFTYHVRFPDAGIYWYHPHQREDIQQELGLYGNLLVRSEYGPANREEILMLDDLLVGDSGLIFFVSSRRRHTSLQGDWSSDVCSSDLAALATWPACGRSACTRAAKAASVP